jgi:hypothetical protein
VAVNHRRTFGRNDYKPMLPPRRHGNIRQMPDTCVGSNLRRIRDKTPPADAAVPTKKCLAPKTTIGKPWSGARRAATATPSGGEFTARPQLATAGSTRSSLGGFSSDQPPLLRVDRPRQMLRPVNGYYRPVIPRLRVRVVGSAPVGQCPFLNGDVYAVVLLHVGAGREIRIFGSNG